MRNQNATFKWGLVVLLVFSLTIRLYFLFTTERTLDMDECVVGTMVKHIAETGEHFVHLLGSDYGGGHALIAYLETPFYLMGFRGDAFVKSATMIFSVLLLLVLALLVSRMSDWRTGLAAGFLLSAFPQYLKASLKVNGYIETLFFLCLAGLILQALLSGLKDGSASADSLKTRLWFVAFGVSCGLALWCFEFALVFLAFFAMIILFHAPKTGFMNIAFGFIGFLIGYSNKLNYILHDDSATSSFVRWIQFHGAGDYFHALANVYVKKLPELFTPNLYTYSYDNRAYSYLFYFLFIAAFAVCAASVALNPPASAGKKNRSFLLMLAFPVYFLGLMPLFKLTDGCARYLLPVSIFCAAILAFAIVRLYDAGGALKSLSVLFACAVVFSLASGVVEMKEVGSTSIYDREEIFTLIDELDDMGVKAVYSDFFIKWHIIFYSGERIIGSDKGFSLRPFYIPYEQKIAAMTNLPYVFAEKTRQLQSLEYTLRAQNAKFKRKTLGRFVIIYDVEI